MRASKTCGRRPNKAMDVYDLSLLETAETAAREAADVLRRHYSGAAGVISAQGKDIKTSADLAAEKKLLGVLSATGLPIVSEESETTHQILADGGLKWIVDPLDGTLNFVRGLPLSCVSVSLWHGRRPVLGVIEDLTQEEPFRAMVGKEAFRGRAPLRVSSRSEVAQAVMATGFPTGTGFETEQIKRFVSFVQGFKKVRLLGSAALSLAYVAAGVLDVYCEENIWLWDIAAGVALVQAAGGTIWITPPDARGKVTVFASNGEIRPPVDFLNAYENLEEHRNA